MKPYYDDGTCTIYHGDCREILSTLADVDLVFTSPPYNLGQPGGTQWARLGDGYAEYDDAMPHAEYVAWQQQILRACWDTLSDTGAIYYNHKPRAKGNDCLLPLELNPGLPLRQIIIWDRCCGFQRQYTHYVPSQEWVLLFARERFRITTLNVFDIWRIAPSRNDEHPATFPLALPTKAISTTHAKLVLDPFMGSGTTLRAAKDLGRKAIGIELSEQYCEIAANRLAQGVLDFGTEQ